MRAQSLLPLALIGALIACDDFDIDGLDDDSNTRIRVLHASPDAPLLDAVLNFERIAKELHYLDLSDYVGVEVNQHTFELRKTDFTGQINRPWFVRTFLSVEPNQRYTILAVDSFPDHVGDDGTRVFPHRRGIEPLTLLDDPTLPPAGNARLRFVDASPSTLLVDVYITAPNVDINVAAPTFRALTFKTVATYITLPAGVYRVRATIAGTKTVLLDDSNFQLTAGTVQTAVMLDGPAGGPPAIVRRLVERI